MKAQQNGTCPLVQASLAKLVHIVHTCYSQNTNAIHQHSTRASNRFVAINCGAIPSELMERELFGHEKGSFTGACEKVMGRLEYANGGTVFLDEIATLPL